jgi:predicted dehydrogenase
LVGVTGLELSRADFYEKELSFQVSCSYGPGRYDSTYEEKGVDYPIGFVRWTEQRNFEAVLDMMGDGRLNVKPLISHRFLIDDADQAYALIGGNSPSLGIVLEYPTVAQRPDAAVRQATVEFSTANRMGVEAGHGRRVSLGMIGSGNYATAVLIPAFKAAGGRLRTVASNTGVTGVHAGRKFGFESTTTDVKTIFADPQVDAIVITTRHDSHASLVQAAVRAGKHVFVEKPLALSVAELADIESVCSAAVPALILMVGFNRRFSPQVQKMRSLLSSVQGPKVFLMTVNAGAIPAEHWTQNASVGGGRIVGEACHFIDLLRYLAGAPIRGFQADAIDKTSGVAVADDKASITLHFEDGSIGTILYTANGHKSFPKERLEVFAGGRILQLDNFRKLTGYGWTGFRRMNLWRQDKGQRACTAAFIDAIASGGCAPIPFGEIMEVSRVSVQIADTLR